MIHSIFSFFCESINQSEHCEGRIDDISFLHTYLSAVTTQKHAGNADSVDMTEKLCMLLE